MALIDRAITGAKKRLEAAEKDLRESRGNPATIMKKQNVVDLRKITLEALLEKRDREKA